MKISGVDIRPGNIIEYEGGIWKVAKIQHTQPGKGGAYMQVEMKNLQDGRKTNVRFRSADTVEKVTTEILEAGGKAKGWQFDVSDPDRIKQVVDEVAADPAELFEKLDQWGLDSIVIPHGTTWGATAPRGASWASAQRARTT